MGLEGESSEEEEPAEVTGKELAGRREGRKPNQNPNSAYQIKQSGKTESLQGSPPASQETQGFGSKEFRWLTE